MAFDFECPEEFTADDLLPHYESWARAKAISLGISGQSDVNTRYVGSTSSERRIRVYRKDLQQLVIGELLGPLLRIELELKGKQAAAWWEVWRRSPENAYAVAAGHIHEMTGLAMQEAIQEVPSLQEPDASDEAEELFQFLCQHGDRLAAWEKAGIPVVPMAIEHARKATNRTRQKRQRDREMALAMVDVDQLQGIVRRLLKLSPNLI